MSGQPRGRGRCGTATAARCQTSLMVNRRPRLEIVAPSATPEEAAAVVAALERFMRDTAPTPAPPPPPRGTAWARAARLEATGRAPDDGRGWGALGAGW